VAPVWHDGLVRIPWGLVVSDGSAQRSDSLAWALVALLADDGLGQQMMLWAIERYRERGCGLVQLTTDARRTEARRFYERLGSEATHLGMKLDLSRL
jgi:GNAT superfamily N-acetyltransferase